MSKPTPRPVVPVVIVLFLFVAVLSPTPAIGASWADRGSVVFDRFLQAISAIWAEAGCGIDENGGCRASQVMPIGEKGQVTANAGCIFDPNGLCRSGATIELDAGCGFDPNGRCQP